MTPIFFFLFPLHQRWPWWSSVVATVVSVSLGISVGFFLFQREQSLLKREERDRYIRLLTLELSQIRSVLQDEKRANITTKTGLALSPQLTRIQPLVLEDAGRSGLFSERASFFMLDISNSVRSFNQKTQFLLDIMVSEQPAPMQDNKLTWALENMDGLRYGDPPCPACSWSGRKSSVMFSTEYPQGPWPA